MNYHSLGPEFPWYGTVKHKGHYYDPSYCTFCVPQDCAPALDTGEPYWRTFCERVEVEIRKIIALWRIAGSLPDEDRL